MPRNLIILCRKLSRFSSTLHRFTSSPNPNKAFQSPFPLTWSSPLARSFTAAAPQREIDDVSEVGVTASVSDADKLYRIGMDNSNAERDMVEAPDDGEVKLTTPALPRCESDDVSATVGVNVSDADNVSDASVCVNVCDMAKALDEGEMKLTTPAVPRCEIDDLSEVGVSDNVSDADRLYKIIMDNSNAEHDMAKALDEGEVKLTTPAVIEVLTKLQYDEKKALRFFMWAGHQEHYSHEPEAFNTVIDILSSTKYKVKQFRIVCDMLDYMKRKGKNSVPIDVLVKILREYTEHHLTHLQKFSKKKKIRVRTNPEINAFNLLIDALCKCSLVEEADLLYKRVAHKIKPDASTYNILFFGWSRVRNPTRAMQVLEDMIRMGHTPENFTYNTAIDTYCRAGMVAEAVELFDFMKSQGSTMSSPTAKTYSIMILAFVKGNRMEECFELVADMVSCGCVPDVSTYKELVEGMCLAGKIEGAYKFLEEMGKKGYPPDIVTYNCFLKVLCDNKKSEEALKLYGTMIELRCFPSVQTFNMLITMFFEMADPDGAFETWDEMVKRGCARDTDTYCVMIEGLFNCGKIEDACYLLEEVMHKDMKLPYQKFDVFLMQLSATGNLLAIHKLSEHMRKFYNPAMARRFAVSQKRKSMSLRGK